MVKLLYIGKSNKRFTHNKTYIFYGMTAKQGCPDEIDMRVYYNSSQMMTFRNKEYFEKNFKLITEKQQNQLIRKIKLKRLNKIK